MEVKNNFSNINNSMHMNLFHWFFNKNMESKRQTMVFSPLSINTAMMLLYRGLNGVSKKEFENAYNISNEVETVRTFNSFVNNLRNVNLTNALFIDEEFDKFIKSSYKDDVKKGKATLETLNFENDIQVVNHINDFISKNTKGMIPNMLKNGDIVSDTVLLIVNTLYFKQDFQFPFLRIDEFSRNYDFTHLNKSVSKTKLMRTEEPIKIRYFSDENKTVQMVLLPYTRKSFTENYSLGLILNENKNNFRIHSNIDEMVKNSTYEDVIVKIPKFEIETRNSLKNFFEEMGLGSLFTYLKCDLSNITERPLHVDNVIHSAKISVDEKGTEASASTAIMCRSLGSSSCKEKEPMLFQADHTFQFFIQNENNTILFSGIYDG